MSALEVFKSRLHESARAAAGAARQLSSLDDMAQNDDYVHSEGLRLSERTPSAASSVSGNSELPSVVEDLSGKFVDALSTAARMRNTPTAASPVRASNGGARNLPQQMGLDQAGESRGGRVVAKASKQAPQKPKSRVQQPQFVSSVAQLYDEDKKAKSAKNQSSMRSRNQQKHPKKDTDAGKGREEALSLATIPSSPNQHANVLLVNERHAHILHELDYYSDDSSDDDKDAPPKEPQNNDVEMGRLGRTSDQLEQELEESIFRQNSLTQGTSNGKGSNGKDVNRFMTMTADLESERERLLQSYSASPASAVPELTPRNSARGTGGGGGATPSWGEEALRSTAGEETNRALRAGLSWVRNVASPQLEALSKQIMTKVSEADAVRKAGGGSPQRQQSSRGPMIGPRHSPARAGNGVEEDKITVANSAAFLADDDMAELERIRTRNSASGVKALVQTCLSNPRLAFIALTFVFALFAYFFSRRRSVDDVL